MQAEPLRNRLRGRQRHEVRMEGFRAAAVLIPIVEQAEGPALLLTERTRDLPSHGGQIAFPGGKLDPCDADPVSCALREAREEIGLAKETVDVLGALDDVPTLRSSFVITPVVGWITQA